MGSFQLPNYRFAAIGHSDGADGYASGNWAWDDRYQKAAGGISDKALIIQLEVIQTPSTLEVQTHLNFAKHAPVE